MNRKLQRAQDLLRKSGLLSSVEFFRYHLANLKYQRENRRFKKQNPNFTLPPAHLAFDAHGHVRWSIYKSSGESTAKRLADEIQKLNIVLPMVNLLEWGCGPGRVIRYLPALLPNAKIYGTDYNPESIEWCQHNIPNITFARNSLNPPLPFEENTFDCIYAISVITHLSEEVCHQWIAELARVLKSGGYLFLWSNGDYISRFLLPEEKKSYELGEFTERAQYEEGKKMFLSFHPPTWIRNQLLVDFDIINHWSGGFSGTTQDVWLVKSH